MRTTRHSGLGLAVFLICLAVVLAFLFHPLFLLLLLPAVALLVL